MSQSAEEAPKVHDCGSLDGNCDCCAGCDHLEHLCTCCKNCDFLLVSCICEDRRREKWKIFHRCSFCPNVFDEMRNIFEQADHDQGQPCPECCAYCTKPKNYDGDEKCVCCPSCKCPPPCVCEKTQQNTIAVEKRKSARFLLRRFLRKAIFRNRESYFPANTAALITVKGTDL